MNNKGIKVELSNIREELKLLNTKIDSNNSCNYQSITEPRVLSDKPTIDLEWLETLSRSELLRLIRLLNINFPDLVDEFNSTLVKVDNKLILGLLSNYGLSINESFTVPSISTEFVAFSYNKVTNQLELVLVDDIWVESNDELRILNDLLLALLSGTTIIKSTIITEL